MAAKIAECDQNQRSLLRGRYAVELSIYEFLCRVTLRAAVIVKQGEPTGLITRGSLLRYFINSLGVSGQLQTEGQYPAEITKSSATDAQRPNPANSASGQ